MKVNRLRKRRNILCRVAILLMVLCLVVVLSVGCEYRERPLKEGEMALTVLSSAFQEGDKIPAKYTCEGQDVSPPLAWSEPPAGTRSLALIVDDPDAPGGVFTHWLLFNIPPDSRELPEAVPTQAELASGALQGKTDFGRIGYGGPCPPPGRPHRYQFTLYALDQPLDLEGGASKKQLLSAMEGHILAQGQLTGTYQR
jgi:Raf kinase inhibitor-like YbhB/YbcL family protein